MTIRYNIEVWTENKWVLWAANYNDLTEAIKCARMYPQARIIPLQVVEKKGDPIWETPTHEQWVKRWIHVSKPNSAARLDEGVFTWTSQSSSGKYKDHLHTQCLEIEVNTGKVRLCNE